MKNIIVLFFAFFAAEATAMAQSKYKTDVSIGDQIVNNSVPGAVYRDASVKASKPRMEPQKSTGAQIRENAVPGVQYKKANSGKSTTREQKATAAPKVASDRKAEKTQPRKMPEPPQLTQ